MVNQANYKDSQTYNIDIDLFYNDFIKQIDSIRGYINISSPNNLKYLNNINESNFGGLSSKLSVEQSYQESRIHAFYRLIGFPVLSNNNKFYSPGHDAVKFPGSFLTRTQNQKYKLEVINNIKSNFYEFSKKREEYYNTKVINWFNYQNINTSTYLISSINIRNFNDHIDKYSEIYDFDFDNQSYLVKLTDALNRSLLEYSSYDGQTDNFPDKLISKRNHNIFPLIVDPRLDLSAQKRVCVPFPTNRTQTIINDTYEAPRCLLESIILERFVQNKKKSDSYNLVSKVKTNFSLIEDKFIFSLIEDEFIINQLSKSSEYSTSDSEMFLKIINLISSMVDKLIEAKADINFVAANTYWLPMCSLNGFDGDLNSVSIPLTSNPKFRTTFDNDLLLYQKKDLLNSITPQASQDQESNGLQLPGFISSLIDFVSNSYGSLIKQSSEDLYKQKKYFDTKANSALKTIEVIMGEFSGLGLCDIIAIIGGLYLVDKKYLLGIIDSDAYTRFVRKTNIFDDQPSIDESMQEINKTIFSLYNIMQKIYTDKSKFGI